jgi:hypothetical protein
MGQHFQMVRALAPASGVVPRMAKTPRGGRQNPRVLVVGRCRPLTGAEERGPGCTPSPSMTATGGQDDAVVCSAHECTQFPLDPRREPPSSASRRPASQTDRRDSPIAVERERLGAGLEVYPGYAAYEWRAGNRRIPVVVLASVSDKPA